MSVIAAIVSNKIIQAGVCSWIAVNFLKFLIYSIKTKKITPSVVLKTGNMPSSHTATIIGITTMIYFLEGLSNIFFYAVFIAIFIMFDSVSLRKQVGDQSVILIEMLKTKHFAAIAKKHKLVKYLGHKKIEVLVGILVGIAVACLLR